MATELIEGKYYNLMHKATKSNPFRGTVLIVQKGKISGKKIFRTVISDEWHLWEDYEARYVGDL